jgi:hypothetical protein
MSDTDTTPNPITLLSGHVSPETAYQVEGYPYGFRLRCTIRYWLEYTPKHGVRMWSQTSNPKRPGLIWNKPKASTYCRFAGAMYLDGNNHMQWSGMHEYMDGAQTAAWWATYGAACHPEAVKLARRWVAAKAGYDQARETGADMASAAAAGRVAFAKATV